MLEAPSVEGVSLVSATPPICDGPCIDAAKPFGRQKYGLTLRLRLNAGRGHLAYALFGVVPAGDSPLLKQAAGAAQTFFDERQFRIRKFTRPTRYK